MQITAAQLTEGMTIYRPRDGKKLHLLNEDPAPRKSGRCFLALGARGGMEALVVTDDETVEVAA